MLSTTEQVAQALTRDAVAREGLRRGIVNMRALVRWMIATHGLVASEEAVLSALRRNPAASRPVDPTVKNLLQASHIDTSSNLCSIMLKGGLSSLPLAGPLKELLDGSHRSLVRIVVSDDNARLVLRADHLEQVLRLFGGMVDEVREHLTEITIRQTKASLNTPGVVAYLVGALSFHGINFFGIVRQQTALHLLVKDEDSAAALAALQGVVGPQAEDMVP